MEQGERPDQAIDHADDDVVVDRLVEKQALGQPIFGNVTDLLRDRVGDAVDAHRSAFDRYAPAFRRCLTEERAGQLGTSGTEQTGDTEHLVPFELQRNAAERSRQRQVLHLQEWNTLVRGRGGVDRAGVHVATGHMERHRGGIEIRAGVVEHLPAVAKDHHVLRDLANLVELVADEEDRDAARLEITDNAQQVANLASGQRGGRFVHDDEARIAQDRLRDRDELAVRGAQPRDPGAERNIAADPPQALARRCVDALPVDERFPGANRGVDSDVFRHRQVGEQGEILIDHLDPLANRFDRGQRGVFATIDDDRALVGRMDAGDDLDQRRFARSVLTDQAAYLAPADLEADIVQRRYARKAFG